MAITVNIEKLVVELLFERDCVVIPDFGAFLVENKPATMNKKTKELIPPYKELVFDQSINNNDWILINYVAAQTHKTIDIAEEQVKGFVKLLRGKILLQKVYEWPGLGEFAYKEHDLIFKHTKQVNLNAESFGLPVVYLDESGKKIQVEEEKPRRRKKEEPEEESEVIDIPLPELNQKPGVPVWVWVIFPLMFLIAVTGYLWDNRGNPSTKSYNPFFDKSHIVKGGVKLDNEFNHEDPIGENIDAVSIESYEKTNIKSIPENESKVDIGKAIENKTENDDVFKQEKIKKQVVVVPTGAIVTEKSNRCFIIFASFSDLKQAEKARQKLENEGAYNAKIIEPNDTKNVYRVSIDDFDSKKEALEKAENYRNKFGEGLWVHIY
ncbi:MAG: SPOR domain-containing protein [Cytophagales bacterium]